MKVIINNYEHDGGLDNCRACWEGYPKICECGGLVHADFGDENENGDYWLTKQCDNCGESHNERNE